MFYTSNDLYYINKLTIKFFKFLYPNKIIKPVGFVIFFINIQTCEVLTGNK